MGLSAEVVLRACERVFVRLCEVGRNVPSGTPAAGFLAAAARRIDEAHTLLDAAESVEDLGEVLKMLARASSLLGDVSRLGSQEVDGLDRISVIVDGLCVTLEMEQREASNLEDDGWR